MLHHVPNNPTILNLLIEIHIKDFRIFNFSSFLIVLFLFDIILFQICSIFGITSLFTITL
jgi:hypothetical protein